MKLKAQLILKGGTIVNVEVDKDVLFDNSILVYNNTHFVYFSPPTFMLVALYKEVAPPFVIDPAQVVPSS